MQFGWCSPLLMSPLPSISFVLWLIIHYTYALYKSFAPWLISILKHICPWSFQCSTGKCENVSLHNINTLNLDECQRWIEENSKKSAEKSPYFTVQQMYFISLIQNLLDWLHFACVSFDADLFAHKSSLKEFRPFIYIGMKS